MKHRLLQTVAFAFSILALPAFCDELRTTNGSILRGRIRRITDGTVTVETEFAGMMTVSQEKLNGIITDQPVSVQLESGNILQGVLLQENGVQKIDTSLGRLDISSDRITALWDAADPSPALKAAEEETQAQRGTWTYELSTDLAGKTGNTERFALSGGFSAMLERPEDRLKFGLRGQRAEEDGNDISNEIEASADYEHELAEKHAWYTRVLLEHDEIVELDLRTTAAFGYGYYLFKRLDHELRTRLGLLMRHESYETGDDEQTLGLDLGVHHMRRFNKSLVLNTDITYTPSLEDAADYVISHESSIESQLKELKNWTLRLGVSNDYNSQPVGDNERLDTTYFLRLVFQWQ